MKDKISVIIVNWNTKKETAKAIGSLLKNCRLEKEILVIDNASVDNSLDFLSRRHRGVKILKNKTNIGYSSANNQGVKTAKNELVLILNPDTKVSKNCVEDLVNCLKNHAEYGAAVPKLINEDGSTQYYYHRRLPTLKYFIASFIYNYTPLKKLTIAREFFLLNRKFNKDQFVEQAAGVCILTTKSVIKKIGGLFDEKLPIFLNDVDFSYRLKKNGFKILLVAASKIIHTKASSTKKLDPYTLRQEILLSTIYYFRKNRPFIEYFLIKISIIIFLSILYLSTLVGLTSSYLMEPILKRKESLIKQMKNISAVLFGKRNHAGLIPINH